MPGMSSLGPLREPHPIHVTELRCPCCGDPLYVATPPAEVSLTSCPGPGCHCVIFVATGRALPWGRRPVALTADGLLHGRDAPRDSPRALATFLAFVAPFVLVPLWAWTKALTGRYPPQLEAMVVVGSSPALITGVLALGLGIVGTTADALERRRARRQRRRALADAPWIAAQRFAEPEP